MIATKRCTLCGIPKPLTEFHRRTRSRDGYQAHCKACARAAWDAADARRRTARRGVITDSDTLAERLADQADAVVEVLFDCADDGAADVVARLADALCGLSCPAAADDYTGEGCLPHDLAVMHTGELLERVPGAERAMGPGGQAVPGDPSSGAAGGWVESVS